MGLITKEVEIKLYSKNIKHFESLGYEIPRRKKNGKGKMCVPIDATIIVKTSDLMPHSPYLVDVECDCCKKNLNIPYLEYTRFNHNGKYYCHACASKIFLGGENNPKWNSNKSDEEREIERKYPEYVEFVKRVLARDNYTCQCCGNTNNSLDVHHLDGYNWCVEKRTDETNAVVLCKTCHSNFHSIYGKGGNTQKQYEEWIGYAIDNLKKYNGILPTVRQIYDYEEKEIYDSIIQYMETHNVSDPSIRAVCNRDVRDRIYKRKDGGETIVVSTSYTLKGHHLFWLDEYETMTAEEILSIVNKKHKGLREVICLTTNKVFNMIVDGAKEYNISTPGNITLNCQNKLKSAGKLPDGTPLVWMYHEDFLNLPLEEQQRLLIKNQESSNDGSFIM